MEIPMSVDSQIVWSLTLYKIVSLLTGFGSLYMGYKLFVSGVWGHAGEVDATFSNNRLVIKRAAPGTFFAVLGTVILCFSVFKGLELRTSSAVGGESATIGLPELPAKAPVLGDSK
jgi:hypothetical protein